MYQISSSPSFIRDIIKMILVSYFPGHIARSSQLCITAVAAAAAC